MLAIAADRAELLEPILTELGDSVAWRRENSAVIVCLAEGSGGDEPARLGVLVPSQSRGASPIELHDGMALQRGALYFAPSQSRVWLEGAIVRVAPRLPNDERPLDDLLLTLAEEWGARSVAVLAAPLGEDGQRGMGRVRAAGGIAWHHAHVAARAKSVTRSGRERDGSRQPSSLGASTGTDARSADSTRGPESTRSADATRSAEATRSPESSRSADSTRGPESTRSADATRSPESSRSAESSRSPGATRSPDSSRRADAQRGAETTRVEPSRFSSEGPASERTPRVLAIAPHLLARIRAGCRAAARMRGGRLRVWVPGCNTGGVAYAVAMALLEATSESSPHPQLSIHGTDLDEAALETARSGRYSARSALGMDPVLRGRFTVDDADTIRVAEAVRRVCRFSRHDLFRDAPLARMDLVVCHGSFEATPAPLRRELAEVIHYSVRHGGLLLSLDRLEAPDHLFKPASQGLLEARPGPAGPALQRRLAGSVTRSEVAPAVEPPPADAAEGILQALGLPLVACDDSLRVTFISLEARSNFRLSARDIGVPLSALTARLPAGAELLQAAQRSLEGALTEELTIRAARRTYLARVCRTRSRARGGVSLVLTDVTPLSDARAVAMAQRLQHAAIARVSEVALSGATLGELCEEALGALFGNIPPCAAGVIVELRGPAPDLGALASRGLSSDPLRPGSDAAALARAVLERGSVVSSRVEDAGDGDEGQPPASEPPPSARGRRQITLNEPGIGCPISAGDEPLGVIALFGRRPSIADRDHQHFIQAVANVLGGAMLRHRTRRRIQLELEVGRALSGAADLSQMQQGLEAVFARTLSASWVELWARDEAPPERWSRISPRFGSESAVPPWRRDFASPTPSDVEVCTSPSGHEVLVPIHTRRQVSHLLRLGGEQLLLPDRELREGLHGVARLLCEFVERLRVLAAARHSEAAHRQKSAELEALYASLPIGVSVHDPRGAILNANSQLAALMAPEDKESAAPLKRLYAEQLPSWIARVIASGCEIHDIELGVQHGEERWFWLCNLAPIRDPAGELHGVSVAVQDITPLKRIESALRETDQQKDDFLAMLGHELRNPMAAIRNATELLGRVDPASPQLARLHGIFDRQTLHTTQLIDGLLDVARVARGKIDLSLVPIDLVQMARQVAEDRRQQFKERALELRLPEGELWVRADRVRLVQIVDNLLSNALKFTRSGGHVSITLSARNQQASLSVEDDGAGIEPELLPFIFEPFRQGQATRAQSQGLGLGLALVKGLVDLHGFGLVATSAGPGRGAQFRIDMPVSSAPESGPPPSRVDSRPLALVLVEDDDDVAETLCELLQGLGHSVERCADAGAALALLGRRQPDVVLCDIGLPGMDGLELASRLRADPVCRNLRLVAMTGYGDASTRARIDAAGFDRRLIKPVQLAALQDCLSRVAALPRPDIRR